MCDLATDDFQVRGRTYARLRSNIRSVWYQLGSGWPLALVAPNCPGLSALRNAGSVAQLVEGTWSRAKQIPLLRNFVVGHGLRTPQGEAQRRVMERWLDPAGSRSQKGLDQRAGYPTVTTLMDLIGSTPNDFDHLIDSSFPRGPCSPLPEGHSSVGGRACVLREDCQTAVAARSGYSERRWRVSPAGDIKVTGRGQDLVFGAGGA